MLEDKLLDPPQVAHTHSAITGQPNVGIQPELALALRRADVDVRRFVPLIGEKMNRYDPICRTVGMQKSYHVRGAARDFSAFPPGHPAQYPPGPRLCTAEAASQKMKGGLDIPHVQSGQC